jgi:AhpD family alkylhydroperoxidase
MTMTPRLNPFTASPAAMQPWIDLGKTIQDDGLEPLLKELVMMRTSQINGCAYCIDMHSKDLRATGETEQRLYLLDAWREAPFYTERERAALAWAEVVTLVTEGHVPNEVYEWARSQFDEQELINLTVAIVTINGGNRLSIAFRSVPGNYRPSSQTISKMAA